MNQIKIKIINVIVNTENKKKGISKYTYKYDDTTTLLKLREDFDLTKEANQEIMIKNIDYGFLEPIPYIISNNEIFWEVNVEDIKIRDLLNTYSIKDVLIIETGFPAAGGMGEIFTNTQTWQLFFEFLEKFIILIELYSFVASIQNWMNNLGRNRKTVPHTDTFIKFIFSRNIWNLYELSKLLGMNEDSCKHFLLFLGYKWNKRKKVYIINNKAIDQFNIKWRNFINNNIL